MPRSKRKAVLSVAIAASLFAILTTECLALMSIEYVTKERAMQLGIEIRANAAGPDAVRVEMTFAVKGELRNFSRVDLDIYDGGKLLATSSLKEERAGLDRITVSFAADRKQLDKISLKLVTRSSERSMTGYVLPMKDFVELDKIR